MSVGFVGEIRMFAGNFAPVGWFFCNGALLPISQYQVLYTLIGTTYGGDGQTTFALPNLQSRFPVHQTTDSNPPIVYVMGEQGGVEQVTLTINQLPAHTHAPAASSSQGNLPSPAGNVWAESVLNAYSSGSPTVAMSASATSLVGGSQPHDNMPPYQAISFIIAFTGVFPSQG
jgi:microcystin-dependent protein